MSEESYLDELNNLNVSTVKDVELTNFDMSDMSLDDMAGFSDLFVESSELENLMAEQEDMFAVNETEADDFSLPELNLDEMDFALPSLDDFSDDLSLEDNSDFSIDENVDFTVDDNAGFPMMGNTETGFGYSDMPREPEMEESEDLDDFTLAMEPVSEGDEFMDDVDNLLKTLSDPTETLSDSASTGEQESFFSLDGLMAMDDEEDFSDELNDTSNALNDTADDAFSSGADLGNLLDSDSSEEEELPEDDLLGDSFLEDDLMSIIGEEEEVSKGKKSKKAKRAKKERDPEKKGLFSKLFDNVHDAKSKRAHEKMLSDEERSALKKQEREEKKAAKKAKKQDPAYLAEQEAKKQAKENAKAQKQAAKEAKKQAKEELKKQRRAEEEAEAMKDQGRINRVGATIVFVCLGAFAASVIFGSSTFSYNQSVTKATEHFGNREYTEAYNELRGVELKDEDIETYDKVITVMYVNKQLDSYNNYYAMQMYPEALDSLLKGLEKYDKHLEAAGQLGVVDDLDYVKNQILEELRITFSLNEKQAYKIIDAPTQAEYSQKVIKTASVAD